MLAPRSFAFAAVLTAFVALGPLTVDMYLPALPALTREFTADVAEVQLTLSVYLAGFAGAQLVAGPLSDRFGRRPLLVGGTALYIAASIACALAPGIAFLIAARFVQSLGVCAGMVVARAAVRDVWGRDGAASVFAYMGTAMALAPLLAPMAGGLIAIGYGWRVIFAVLALFGAALLYVTATGMAETNAHKSPDAMKPARLLGNYRRLAASRLYLAYVLTGSAAFAGLFAFISGSPFVLVDFLGLSPPAYGLSFGLVAAGFMVGSTVSGRLARRVGIDRLIRAGVILCLVGGAMALGMPLALGPSVAVVIGPMVVFLAGFGLVAPNAMAGALGPYPEMAGAASALLGFTQMSLAAVAGAAVGQLHDGTQLVMTAGVCVSGIATAAAFHLLRGRAR